MTQEHHVRSGRLCAAVSSAVLLVAAVAAAADESPALPVGRPETPQSLNFISTDVPDTDQMLARSLGALAVIGGGSLALWFILRKLTARRNGLLKVPGGLRIVARLPLAPKNSLFVVRACNSLLLLGVSDKGIQLITELPDENPPTFANVLAEHAEDAGRRGPAARMEVSA